ncbi:HAD family phosphatase [Clostridium sp. FP2]|uniref:Haloacid dehalogenase n=1 Tax=Clostridium tagluense TaxID=360422 RepID=A0A401UI43_9CLOT|nr:MULTISPECIES: HAD family phosphatase [Clostridium]MBW9156232.1 HAD family phosphatase [Clostridium tagluense]MBZ9625778.1 HAD family phosphatase [Clostridium sp. FP2]MCB2298026.1 HAD family phosphatase [Clostridium tagluense]WLC65531.1 HAD family phosphatase [Clostridium tagluense]GCD09231.1 haloacid dehalogenase [Clostridium tagluense]
MLTNIKAAIFDLDGTLIDSMWVWGKIDEHYFKKLNMDLPSNLKSQIEHLSFDDTAAYFKSNFGILDTIEEIKKEWTDLAYVEYLNNVKLKPGVVEFLSLLKTLNIKIGLATSNSKDLLEAVLNANGIYHYFDCITLTSEVSRGKNFPDVYLLAAERLGVEPSECIVFEDILPAVKGAKAAGMRVVGVYDDFSKEQREDIINHADMFIFEYHELTTAI